MDDHGYDQAACRRAAELLREEAERLRNIAGASPQAHIVVAAVQHDAAAHMLDKIAERA